MKLREKCESCGHSPLKEYRLCRHPVKMEDLASDDFRVTNKDYGISLETLLCPQCGLVQPAFCLKDENIIKFYMEGDDGEYLKSSYNRGLSNYEQVAGILKEMIGSDSRILEVGAGSGATISFLKNDFFSVEGVEPNTSFCKFAAKEYRVNLRNTSYEEIEEKEVYDAIIAFDVIEHVASPRFFVEKTRSLLKEGGYVLLSTPDFNSLVARVMGKKWWHIRPAHLYYFSKKSFSKLINRYGFRVIYKKSFYWHLPLNYIVDSIQKLLFKKSILKSNIPKTNLKINLLDSSLYVIQKESF